jgi:hypothetical protein
LGFDREGPPPAIFSQISPKRECRECVRFPAGLIKVSSGDDPTGSAGAILPA